MADEDARAVIGGFGRDRERLAVEREVDLVLDAAHQARHVAVREGEVGERDDTVSEIDHQVGAEVLDLVDIGGGEVRRVLEMGLPSDEQGSARADARKHAVEAGERRARATGGRRDDVEVRARAIDDHERTAVLRAFDGQLVGDAAGRQLRRDLGDGRLHEREIDARLVLGRAARLAGCDDSLARLARHLDGQRDGFAERLAPDRVRNDALAGNGGAAIRAEAGDTAAGVLQPTHDLLVQLQRQVRVGRQEDQRAIARGGRDQAATLTGGTVGIVHGLGEVALDARDDLVGRGIDGRDDDELFLADAVQRRVEAQGERILDGGVVEVPRGQDVPARPHALRHRRDHAQRVEPGIERLSVGPPHLQDERGGSAAEADQHVPVVLGQRGAQRADDAVRVDLAGQRDERLVEMDLKRLPAELRIERGRHHRRNVGDILGHAPVEGEGELEVAGDRSVRAVEEPADGEGVVDQLQPQPSVLSGARKGRVALEELARDGVETFQRERKGLRVRAGRGDGQTVGDHARGQRHVHALRGQLRGDLGEGRVHVRDQVGDPSAILVGREVVDVEDHRRSALHADRHQGVLGQRVVGGKLGARQHRRPFDRAHGAVLAPRPVLRCHFERRDVARRGQLQRARAVQPGGQRDAVRGERAVQVDKRGVDVRDELRARGRRGVADLQRRERLDRDEAALLGVDGDVEGGRLGQDAGRGQRQTADHADGVGDGLRHAVGSGDRRTHESQLFEAGAIRAGEQRQPALRAIGGPCEPKEARTVAVGDRDADLAGVAPFQPERAVDGALEVARQVLDRGHRLVVDGPRARQHDGNRVRSDDQIERGVRAQNAAVHDAGRGHQLGRGAQQIDLEGDAKANLALRLEPPLDVDRRDAVERVGVHIELDVVRLVVRIGRDGRLLPVDLFLHHEGERDGAGRRIPLGGQQRLPVRATEARPVGQELHELVERGEGRAVRLLVAAVRAAQLVHRFLQLGGEVEQVVQRLVGERDLAVEQIGTCKVLHKGRQALDRLDQLVAPQVAQVVQRRNGQVEIVDPPGERVAFEGQAARHLVVAYRRRESEVGRNGGPRDRRREAAGQGQAGERVEIDHQPRAAIHGEFDLGRQVERAARLRFDRTQQHRARGRVGPGIDLGVEAHRDRTGNDEQVERAVDVDLDAVIERDADQHLGRVGDVE